MAIQTISRIQNRRGVYADLPAALAEGEFGWCLDTRQLFIGNTSGYGGNTEVLTAYSQNTSLINTIFSANGVDLTAAVSRTLQAKLDDIASIKDFGAVGDGVTDDAPAINAAIAQLLQGYPANGNTAISLFFPAGTYLIASPILLYPYVSLIGDGSSGTTIMAASGTSMPFMFQTVDSLGQTDANVGLNGALLPTHIHVRDMAINTNDQQISAVQLLRYTHVRFERVWLVGGWHDGFPGGNDAAFTCETMGNAVDTHDAQLVDCDIQNFSTALLMNDPVQYTTLSRCVLHTLYRGIGAGLAPTYNGPSYTTVTQSRFYTIANYGIYVGDASSNPGVTSIGNTFYDTGTADLVKSLYWGTSSTINASIGDVFSLAPGVVDHGTNNLIIDAQQNNGLGGSGYSGYSGHSGYSGYSGYSGLNGAFASSGYSGISGYSGYSGYSGNSLSARTTVAVTTGSLTAGSSANITAVGYVGYALYSIQVSFGAWVTVYTSIADRTSDVGRSINTDPTPGSGVVAEAITTGAGTVYFSPAVIGYSSESSPNSNIQMKVYNNGGSTSAITVTLTLLQLES